MIRAGWEKKSLLVLAVAAIAAGAVCPVSPPMSDMESSSTGGVVTLRLENQSGMPVIVTARYTIDDTQVRETVRKLDPEGDDAIATVLPTRTRFLEIVAVAGEDIDPAVNSLVQPGEILREGTFQWQQDFRNGDTFVFVIPSQEVPGPGTLDCNSNGVLDGVDIANGTSQDCDIDGTPDECDSSLAAHDPSPANGATDVLLNASLSWNQIAQTRTSSNERGIATVDQMRLNGLRAVPLTPLSEFYSATGRVFVSIDGGGSNDASHTIEVQKSSATATVRKAFVAAASTGFSSRQLADGDVQMTPPGSGVNWSMTVPSAIGAFNHLADVTAMVSSAINAAPAGRIPFAFSEVNTSGIDGEVLIVVFDDPTQPADRTAILLFGSQNIAGDNFGITLGEPINPLAAGAMATMSLGISYGFQPTGQVSLIDVNGQRLTSSAGGQDDGPPGCNGSNGALITVGGLDNSTSNPINPMGGATSCSTDDEYYSLLPFITNADTQISVDTINPSNDDNIFFGAFVLSGAAVLGEGIVLGPSSATNPIGTSHTVVATVTNDQSQPVVGRNVTFSVLSGPNQGVAGVVATGIDGQASFTYSGVGGPGLDLIQASFVDSQSQTRVSNIVSREWTPICNMRFTVLFGTDPIPTAVLCNDISATFCQPPGLQRNTTYFWQVVSNNGVNAIPGPVWSFTTTPNATLAD